MICRRRWDTTLNLSTYSALRQAITGLTRACLGWSQVIFTRQYELLDSLLRSNAAEALYDTLTASLETVRTLMSRMDGTVERAAGPLCTVARVLVSKLQVVHKGEGGNGTLTCSFTAAGTGQSYSVTERHPGCSLDQSIEGRGRSTEERNLLLRLDCSVGIRVLRQTRNGDMHICCARMLPYLTFTLS